MWLSMIAPPVALRSGPSGNSEVINFILWSVVAAVLVAAWLRKEPASWFVVFVLTLSMLWTTLP
jgi:hypothetical protein